MFTKRLLTGGILRDNEKADILLVAQGFKPAAMVELSCIARAPRTPRTHHEHCKEDVADLKEILREAGFCYTLHFNHPKGADEVTRYSYIAKNERTLKKVMSADKKKNDQDRRLAVGTLLGYPKSAVQAFARGESISNKDLPVKVRRGTVLKFLNFRLSPAWKTELDYVRARAKMIKKVSPELYKKIVRSK